MRIKFDRQKKLKDDAIEKKMNKNKTNRKKNEGQNQKKNNLKDLYENYGGLGTNFQAKREKKRKEKKRKMMSGTH
jgi:hypothetical protein